MTERERILAKREAGHEIVHRLIGCEMLERVAAERWHKWVDSLFPHPKHIVPTVRQGTAEGGKWWYRVLVDSTTNSARVCRYSSKFDAQQGIRVGAWGRDWPLEDQPIVAHLLTLPLTEEVEDTGDD